MSAPDPRHVAVLYSGGTDSTLVACQAAEAFERVHLLTYRRLGMFNLEHSERNVAALKERYGAERIVRPPRYCVDKLFRHVSYERFLPDLLRFRGQLLTTCGLCKLAMHLRTLAYCVDNGVGTVWDGANKHMTIFPMQMAPVLERLRGVYASAGIRYENPVFDYDDDQGIDFGSFLWGLSPERGQVAEASDARTTGRELYQRGLLPEPDVKGTAYDKKIQGRCYQFALFNLYARWFALERYDMDEYRRRSERYYGVRHDRCQAVVDEFLDDPPGCRLGGLLERS
jgi:hypothetical protein